PTLYTLSLHDALPISEAQSAELDELDTSRANAKTELESLARLTLLPEAKYRDLNLKYGDVFRAEIGAEAIRHLLAEINMDKLVEDRKSTRLNSSHVAI